MVEWYAQVGTFCCARQDCEKPEGKPCPKCGMPEPTVLDLELLKLWSRCKQFNALPAAGGLLDQPATLMDLMDLVGSTVDRVHAKQQEDETNTMKKQRILEDLNRG